MGNSNQTRMQFGKMRQAFKSGKLGMDGGVLGVPSMKPPTPVTQTSPAMKPITMMPPEGGLPLPAESKKPLPGMEGTPILDQAAQLKPVQRIPRQTRLGGGLGDGLGRGRMMENNVF
jgi:hypothetical protein